MRISDWSSDVCSSDLFDQGVAIGVRAGDGEHRRSRPCRDHVSGHVERGYAAGGEGAVDGSAGRGRDRLRGAHAVGVRREGRSEIDRADVRPGASGGQGRSEEHTSELQSLMRISDDVLCLKKNITTTNI